MRPIVSVIVPVFNDCKSLAVLLRALADQDFPRERFECLVIDNDSDEPIRIPPDCPLEVRVLQEQRPGSYAARNLGLCEARGRILAFTDADCIPGHDWLSSAVQQIVSEDQPVMVAGHVEFFCPSATSPSAIEWHSIVNDLQQARYLSHFQFAATANLITTRDVFDRVGPFNPDLLSGGDVEWGQRAWALGVRQVYAENIVVRHPARPSWQSLAAKMRRITGGHYRLHGCTGRPLWASLATILQVGRASFRRVWHDARLPTLGCRLRVLAIDVAVRLIQLGEVVRLRLGGQPRR